MASPPPPAATRAALRCVEALHAVRVSPRWRATAPVAAAARPSSNRPAHRSSVTRRIRAVTAIAAWTPTAAAVSTVLVASASIRSPTARRAAAPRSARLATASTACAVTPPATASVKPATSPGRWAPAPRSPVHRATEERAVEARACALVPVMAPAARVRIPEEARNAEPALAATASRRLPRPATATGAASTACRRAARPICAVAPPAPGRVRILRTA